MMVQVEDILETYFKYIPSKLYTSQVTAFEAYELCLRNIDFFTNTISAATVDSSSVTPRSGRGGGGVLSKYTPNLFRFLAWWPCNFLEEACELLPALIIGGGRSSEQAAAEVLHLVLDLPCLAAALQLQHHKLLDDQERLQVYLKCEVNFIKDCSLFVCHAECCMDHGAPP